MRRSPLQQIGDMIGMYAYLTAMRGLQYWPRIRQDAIDELPLPYEDAEREALSHTVEYGYEEEPEHAPVV